MAFQLPTFIALVHLVEAISILVFNNEIRLLQLYPLINEKARALFYAIVFYMFALKGMHHYD